ncbi:hypothetical protein [Gimesia algae]|uniref:Uncharacterized protein n=1 Tax=Gimesia algae TaxID=2527971 RepID=A0A517VAY6_9PLAN|nr:hypothetical protein [Gimesia algae]QDT90162.1 hypothetical protein Pan161_18120 [Gimesia algae]
MDKLTIVTGLPGSGKTHLCKEECQKSIQPVWIFFEYSPLKCLINIVGDATASIHEWESRFNAYVNHLKIKYEIPGDINPLRVEIHPDYLPILEHADCRTLLSEIEKCLNYSLETNSQRHLIGKEVETDLRARANQLKDIWNQLKKNE